MRHLPDYFDYLAERHTEVGASVAVLGAIAVAESQDHNFHPLAGAIIGGLAMAAGLVEGAYLGMRRHFHAVGLRQAHQELEHSSAE